MVRDGPGYNCLGSGLRCLSALVGNSYTGACGCEWIRQCSLSVTCLKLLCNAVTLTYNLSAQR